MNKLVCRAALTATLAGAVATGPAALAQEKKAEAPYALTGNIGLASQYRYRGIEQTAGKPAVQGGLDFVHSTGLYVGTWASNVSWLADFGARGSSLEWDFYGGYKQTVGDFGYDVGVLRYYYPMRQLNGATTVGPNTTELYVAGSWKTVMLKYSHSVTDLFGTPDSKGSGYLDLTGTFELAAGLNLVGHVGYQRIPGSGGFARSRSDASYADWKLGVTYDIAGVTLGAAYVDTNARGGLGRFYYQPVVNRDLGKGTVVLTVGKTF